ncbi:hypothetical protein THAOC_25382 [Thalassiosira oceanica]|uniref:Uncharacterized protein n=1 Tax=Thalassiosira oceanica TaxID=159749 RepID=K0RMH7_THAOC|nr:hypothetical protein THAOC_25382 [Thalassiosira oceanica]|eukprot:EJK54943.1 hypothetical protein THAOC_25382 [Thalassiosira oceanica]
MSRPVGSVKGSPPEQQNVKPMAYKVQIFRLGYPEPEDAFSSRPVKDPQSVNSCYAKDQGGVHARGSQESSMWIFRKQTELETCKVGDMGSINTTKMS